MAKAGLNKSALAKKIGVSLSTVSRWHGENAATPTPETVAKIASVTGVDSTWLSLGSTSVSELTTSQLNEEPAAYEPTGIPPAFFRAFVRALPSEAVKDAVLSLMLDASKQGRTMGRAEHSAVSMALDECRIQDSMANNEEAK